MCLLKMYVSGQKGMLDGLERLDEWMVLAMRGGSL